MATPQEQRLIRLKNDHQQMVNIRGDIIQWKPLKGEAPYVEIYELKIKIKTIISSRPEYRSEHTIKLEVPDNYPRVAPQITMITSPYPFHPNWYSSGRWCFGSWDISEGLGDNVIRMIKTLQFDLEITNPNSPANSTAKDWFLANKNKGVFPCDRTPLPDPEKSRFEIKQQAKKKFSIQQ